MKTIKEKYPLLFEEEEKQIKYKKALNDAKVIADILKDQFGATEVRCFGSLTDEARFSSLSDIDIAVKGVPPGKILSSICRNYEKDFDGTFRGDCPSGSFLALEY